MVVREDNVGSLEGSAIIAYIYHCLPATVHRHQANENWENTIISLNKMYKDPKKFWSKIKRLKGSQNTPSYIIHNTTKIHEDKDKEPIFREI